jgi:hypothetical protein
MAIFAALGLLVFSGCGSPSGSDDPDTDIGYVFTTPAA